MFIPLPIVAASVALIVGLLLFLLLRSPHGRGDLIEAPKLMRLPRDADDEVRSLAARSDGIAATRLLRETSGLGLKQAKEAVEQMEREI